VPLHESKGWRWNFDEVEAAITPKTRILYVNSPSNPTGGVLSRADIEAIAALAERRGLWLLSDEAYEDVVFDEAGHFSAASLPGMYERTISFYTFSKTYAMTGLRLGYVAAKDAALRDRMKKALFYTASNVASVVQFGGIGALEGSQAAVDDFRNELRARRDLFYAGIREHAADVFSGEPPKGAFYAFLRINPEWLAASGRTGGSLSWTMTEFLIAEGRIGCVPGVDFGAHGEGYLRFCFARDRRELTGALESMGALFGATTRSRNPPKAPAPVAGS
jgi:aspartate/methionine/tyrosine aminotransferase